MATVYPTFVEIYCNTSPVITYLQLSRPLVLDQAQTACINDGTDIFEIPALPVLSIDHIAILGSEKNVK